MKRIVIVGGGFGGVVAARKLSKLVDLDVTLISDLETFRYHPALYRVATGFRKTIALLPLRDILPSNVHLIIDRASSINCSKRTIKLSKGQRVSYDIVILALGVETNYFNIPGLAELSYGIKDTSALKRLHKHLHDDLIEDRKIDKNYIVVGGGPTGVELASNLNVYLSRIIKSHHIRKKKINIKLIEATDSILPSLNPHVRQAATNRLKKLGVDIRINSKVEAETTRSLRVNDESIPTHTVIWTAGTTNNSFFAQNREQFSFSERGKVEVDEHLRVDEHTYVIGDNAESKFSGLAQTAIHQAQFVAKNIQLQIEDKELLTYKPHQPTYIVPVGNHWAVLQYGAVSFSGAVASIVRLSADILGYGEVMGFFKSLKMWRNFGLSKDCSICADNEN